MNNNSNKMTFKPFKEDEDEDRFGVNAFIDGKAVGTIIGVELIDAYQYYLDDVMDEDEYDKLFGDDMLVVIEHIEVRTKFDGIGTKLMEKFMYQCRQMGYAKFYLNASPMGFDGLDIDSLILFYRKFDFEVYKHQGNNAIMIKV